MMRHQYEQNQTHFSHAAPPFLNTNEVKHELPTSDGHAENKQLQSTTEDVVMSDGDTAAEEVPPESNLEGGAE